MERTAKKRMRFTSYSKWIPSPLALVLLLSFGFYLCFPASAARSTTSRPAINVTNIPQYDEAPVVDGLPLDDDSPSTSRPVSFAPRATSPELSGRNDRKQEPLSEDCFAIKESMMMKRRSGAREFSTENTNRKEISNLSHQRLRPKVDQSSIRHLNISLNTEGSLDGALEHIPECTGDGKFEPIQCLMAYCWCVNKYGQAFKNSAKIDEKPVCDKKLYESESNDLLVVTGIGIARLKNPLKTNDSKNSNDRNGLANDPASGDRNGHLRAKDSEESEFSRRVGSSLEPSLALVPNECAMSRENAMARKSKHSDLDGIWIPDCDPINEKLYGEKQCHKSKICWCVDQVTGLPLRSNEQLTKGPGINCTEVRRIIEIGSFKAKQESHRVKPSFFHGFSESCDAERRSEFVHNLIERFKQQLSEYLKQNPSHSPPRGVSSSNPYRLSGEQVALWRFTLLDLDNDGKLDDREWSRFKMSFKLVEKLGNHPPEQAVQQQDANQVMSPLYILRSQRKCWRDFLEFCGDGDVLDYSSINRAKWLSCTEQPAALAMLSPTNSRPRHGSPVQNPGGIPDAYTRAAAETRRSSKNPFLGILKPD